MKTYLKNEIKWSRKETSEHFPFCIASDLSSSQNSKIERATAFYEIQTRAISDTNVLHRQCHILTPINFHFILFLISELHQQLYKDSLVVGF